MAAKFLSLAFTCALCAGLATAQPDPKKPDDKKLVTKVYNIKLLLGETGKARGLTDADAVIKFLLQNVSIGEVKPGADGPQLIERDGGKLEVRATEKVHGEIKDFLDALLRLQDLAVDIKTDVIELDAVAHTKLVAVLAKRKMKPPVLFAVGEKDEEDEFKQATKVSEEANKILKAGRVVQTSSGRFVNGAAATISARRVVVPYTNDGKPAGVARENPMFMKEGFGLVALPVVSFDRRYIRFKLTEQSTAITGIKKRELFEIEGKPVFAQSPVVEDLGATGSAEIADGSTLIFRLAYAPKDKVWVAVVQPTIYIKAEEEEVERQRIKGWFYFFRP